MKEESQHHFHNEKHEPHIQWEVLDKPYTTATSPKPRYKHLTFIYQNTLYLYGGTTIPTTEPFDDPLDIYRFSFTTKEWQKVRLRCNSKDLEVVSGHCATLNGNRWFMFGGTNNDFRSNNYLWRLNLQTFEMNKLQNRGEVPSARDSARLFCIDKNWLLLYGGVSINNVEIYNNFHFYNIETRHWTKCEGPYQYQAYSRFDPALVQVNNKLYMFGGTYRNRQNQQLYLNDFYQFDISVPTCVLPFKISIKRLISEVMPEARSGHALADLGDGYILLLGGQNSQTKMKDGIKYEDASVVRNAWIYCIEANLWRKISVKNSNLLKYHTQFSLTNIQNNKFALFGGIHNYNSVSNELLQVNILNYHLRTQPNVTHCLKCDQKQQMRHKDHYISAEIIQDIAESIAFPFAAVGLLIDNGFNHGAAFINIFYHQQIGAQKIKAFRIEDNAKIFWSDQQFFNSMANFSASPSFLPSSTDKKIKASFHRQNLRLQYGSNCKIGSLRLGSGFLHISYSQDGQLVRICLFKKEVDEYKNNRYVLLHYTYSAITKQSSTSEMSVARKYVQQKYGELIEDALFQYNVRNTLFILQPRIQNPSANQDQQMELKVNFANNDIINGLYSNYTTLQKAGYNISECVDVSLKAYITCLYLKNQTTLIALSVRNTDPISIPTQAYLQKVDKLCKYKHVLQINNLVQFQFKIVELYYLYDLKRKLNYFNNGLLIYHKNRLISRYKYPLGELIPRKIYKMEGNCNLIRMFGFIELPDHVPVNIFKTNVIHPLLTEKLFSRLKFMNKMFKKELQKMVVENNLKRIAPTKLSNQEKEQDLKDNPEFKAVIEITGKEKHRKFPQKERSRRGNSNLQTKPGSQIENEQPKIAVQYKKDETIEPIKVGLSQMPSEIVQNKICLQEKVMEMREVEMEINENEMRNEQASDSSSSSEEREYEQMVEEQGIEIRHFGIDKDNQHIQKGAQQNSAQMKQKIIVKMQEINLENGHNASKENGNNGSREIQEQLSGDSKKPEVYLKQDNRDTVRAQKVGKQNQQNQIQGDPKQQFDH